MDLEQASQETGSAERPLEPFGQALANQALRLERGKTTTLQINVGLLCNQSCRHCHLSAGPHRPESMSALTAEAVVAYAERSRFDVIDITGGAPELNPNTERLIKKLSSLAPRLMIRSNLSALEGQNRGEMMGLLKDHRVVIVASFPSYNEGQADSQRGRGVFQTSIDTLKKLNAMGYGQDGTGLELNLVSNPTGAFLPTPQGQMEQRFREVLKKRWGIVFNHLYSFANVPLGRFRQWLLKSGNLDSYLQRLASRFNPCALDGLMCRTLVSVSWDGTLYDCDFNLARDLPMGGKRTHVSSMEGPPEPGNPIAVGDHCYTCTAGAGFT
jgi:radical SAM/Cys-rich protein